MDFRDGCNLRPYRRNFRRTPLCPTSHSFAGWPHYHSCLLVHRLNIFCKPSSDNRTRLVRQLCRDCSEQCVALYRRTIIWQFDRALLLGMAIWKWLKEVSQFTPPPPPTASPAHLSPSRAHRQPYRARPHPTACLQL